MLNPKIYDPWTMAKPQSFKNSKHIISCQWQIDQQMDGKRFRCVQEEYTLWAPHCEGEGDLHMTISEAPPHCSSLQLTAVLIWETELTAALQRWPGPQLG